MFFFNLIKSYLFLYPFLGPYTSLTFNPLTNQCQIRIKTKLSPYLAFLIRSDVQFNLLYIFKLIDVLQIALFPVLAVSSELVPEII